MLWNEVGDVLTIALITDCVMWGSTFRRGLNPISLPPFLGGPIPASQLLICNL